MMRSSDKRFSGGFTLVEVLIAVSVLAFCLTGLLATYINMFFLTSLLRDTTVATNAVQAQLEQVRNTGYNCTSYDFTFTGGGITDGSGKVIVTDDANYATTALRLKNVKITACFTSRGRLVGNSISDCTASPVEAVTYISE